MALIDWTQYNLGSPTVEIRNSSGPSNWFDSDWAFRKSITVSSSSIPSTQTNFPLLVKVNLTAALFNGDDVLFTASDGLTKLDHEIDFFEPDSFGNGDFLAWVRIPSLSDTLDTVIYVYYDNPFSPPQENPTDVWNSNYVGVWHLGEDPADTGSIILDSTSNAINGNPLNLSSNDQVPGQIGGSIDFEDADNDQINFGAVAALPLTAITVSAWVKPDVFDASTHPIVSVDRAGFFTESWELALASNDARFAVYGTGSSVVLGNNYTAGVWQYVVGTWFGNGTISIYQDGALTNSASVGFTPIGYNGKSLNFAVNEQLSTNTFDGGIDEIRISNIARPADWITIEYDNQVDPDSFLTIGSAEHIQLPLDGVGSLSQSGMTSLVTMVEEDYIQGLTRGRIRELIRPDVWEGSGIYDAGVFFMASQEDLTSSGSCYTYSINSDSNTLNTRVELQYHSVGIEETPVTLYSGPMFNRKSGDIPLIIALEVEWVYEPTILDGILIILREGHSQSLTDFSNLSEVTRIIIFEPDPVFLGVSAAEGIYMDSRGSGGNLTVTRDRTRITRLLP